MLATATCAPGMQDATVATCRLESAENNGKGRASCCLPMTPAVASDAGRRGPPLLPNNGPPHLPNDGVSHLACLKTEGPHSRRTTCGPCFCRTTTERHPLPVSKVHLRPTKYRPRQSGPARACHTTDLNAQVPDL
ncbi:hypothetical protein PtA15_14A325 [Puccinia triticina]|uniref:Uncharacterized protein n=1 Tax=Puccinia triticina TaxID=208348 RepID=A0ABY7D207_9BASI|nr:uncharacterized protein PtA15_14A325 [Puccinia triticina]WAQ91441.1 hypothetical protein PtA15_14A325 [Puccinia triticina]